MTDTEEQNIRLQGSISGESINRLLARRRAEEKFTIASWHAIHVERKLSNIDGEWQRQMRLFLSLLSPSYIMNVPQKGRLSLSLSLSLFQHQISSGGGRTDGPAELLKAARPLANAVKHVCEKSRERL